MAQMLYQTKRLNDNLIQLLALYKDVGKPGYPFDRAAAAGGPGGRAGGGPGAILLQSRGIAWNGLPAAPDLDAGRRPGHRRAGTCHQQRHPLHARPIRLSVRDRRRPTSNCAWKTTAKASQALLEAGSAPWMACRRREFLTNSTGLGLYFSSEVAKMHKHRGQGGSIALENGGTLGGGCFILRLP
jgi:hypothetical protein